MNATDNVCTIIHSDLRQGINDGIDMLVVGLSVFALDGINRNFEMLHQRCRGIILVERGFDAQSVTSAPPAFKVRIRLAVSVVTCRQAPMRTPCRVFLFETFADRSKYWHVAICPKNAVKTGICKRNVFNVIVHGKPLICIGIVGSFLLKGYHGKLEECGGIVQTSCSECETKGFLRTRSNKLFT